STRCDSFADGLLDCPHYTRPEVFEGVPVPEPLMSGHHARIARWRRERALATTAERRPDLVARARSAGRLSAEDEAFLATLEGSDRRWERPRDASDPRSRRPIPGAHRRKSSPPRADPRYHSFVQRNMASDGRRSRPSSLRLLGTPGPPLPGRPSRIPLASMPLSREVKAIARRIRLESRIVSFTDLG